MLVHSDEYDLNGQVGMVEQGWEADELIEQAVDIGSLWRTTGLGPRSVEKRLDCDGVHNEYAVPRQDSIELASQSGKGCGLYLDEEIAAADIDDEAVELDLELVTGLGEDVLHCRMK